MNSIKLLTTITLITLTVVSVSSEEQCKMTLEDLDECASATSVLGNEKIKIPVNDEELNVHCNNSFKSLICLRKYVRTCLPPYGKTLFGVFMYDAKREMKKRCQTKDGREEFLAHMKCSTKVDFKPLHRCMHNYEAQIEWLYANLGADEHVSASCCALHQLHECFVSQSGIACDHHGLKTSEYIDKMISSIISEGVDFTCGVFKTLNDCKTKMDATKWDKLYQIGTDPEKAGFQPKFKSPMTTVVKFYSQVNHQPTA